MSRITMPSVVDSMSEGVVGRWLKRDGDRVERNDELVEIETDKATMAYESPEAGYLEIVAAEGSTVAVGELIAHLRSEPADRPREEPSLPVRPEHPEQLPPAEVAETPAPQVPDGVRATPLARQLAETNGISLASIDGSGPRGRVTRGDVASSLGLPSPQRQDAPRERGSGPARRQPELVDLSRLQQIVARRMEEAHATVPDFQVETEVSMDAALSLREELKRLGGDPAPSLNDFMIRASALALRQHPHANGSYQDGRFVLHPVVQVGMAVAVDDGLLVATVTNADERPLFEIARETSRLADLAHRGALAPTDITPATFTVSNLGMFGMTAITPIIDAPQAAILGVGSIREALALEDGKVVVRRLITLRLSCDHRILYGADAARFLSTIRELLEEPLRLLV